MALFVSSPIGMGTRSEDIKIVLKPSRVMLTTSKIMTKLMFGVGIMLEVGNSM